MGTETVLVAVGDIAAGMAAIAAVVGLKFARQTVREAKTGRIEAEQAAKDAAADRHEAELDRQRRRVERVGEIVEDLFWRAYRDPESASPLSDKRLGQPRGQWIADRNRLGHAMVGLPADWLPYCIALMNDATPDQAQGHATLAREEVRMLLTRLWQRRDQLAK